MSNKQRYLELPDLQERVPVFFRPWWLDTVSRDWDIAIAERNGSVAGLLPYHRDIKAGIKLLRNPQLTPYLGPLLFTPGHLQGSRRITWEEETFDLLWSQLPAWDSFDMLCMPGFQNFLLLHAKGFSNNVKLTYHIDLSKPEEELLANMRSHRKRVAQAAPFLDIAEGLQYVSAMLDLHRKTFERKGKKYVYDSECLENIIRNSYLRNSGNLWVALDKEGNVAGAVFTVHDAANCYLLLTAVDHEKAHQGTICLLIWHAIRQAKNAGLAVFDFEGSMDKGIEAFFRHFGGERKTYLGFSRNKSIAWKIKKALFG